MNRKNRRANNQGTLIDQQKADLIKQALDAAAELVQYEKLEEATAIYNGVLEHAPQNTTAMFNLGIIAHRKLNYKIAEDWFNKLLKISPKDAETISSLGVVKLDQGDIETALELSKKAIKCNPTAEAHARRGSLLRELGDMEASVTEIQKAIKLNPDYIGAYYDLSVSKKFTSDDEDLKNMAKLAERADKQPIERQIQLQFALGKAYADAKNYEKSFSHYKTGNDLKRKTLNYETSFMEHYLEDIQNIFTPELMDKFKDCGNKSDKPIFIVGMPRSGTTLVEQILASHPDVYGAGELDTLRNVVPIVQNPALPEFFKQAEASCHQKLIDTFTPELLEQIGTDYLQYIDKIAPNSPHVTDKMPFNFLWAGLIRLALPNAKIVHCTRNGMDNGLSIYRQLFTQDIPWAYDLKEIGSIHNSYKQLTAYWHQLFPEDIFEINYESLVSDQEAWSRKLLKFCNIEWNDDCLEFYNSRRQVKTASVYQVRQPIYKDSMQGWKRFEKGLKPLADTLLQ